MAVPFDPRKRRNPEPRIKVLPRLSAPIDQGAFIEKPPLTGPLRFVRIAIYAAVITLVAAIGLTHGSFLR